MTSARNPILMYDLEALTDEVQIREHKRHKAVRRLEVSEEAFTLIADCSDPLVTEQIRKMIVKMQKTLDDCREAVLGRTPYLITQERVLLRPEVPERAGGDS